MECQYDQTTSHEVWNECWFTLHLTTYTKVMLLQWVSPVNQVAQVMSNLWQSHLVTRVGSRSYQKEMITNNGESKMPILCFRVRATHIIIATRRSQVRFMNSCWSVQLGLTSIWDDTHCSAKGRTLICTWTPCMFAVQVSLLSTRSTTKFWLQHCEFWCQKTALF